MNLTSLFLAQLKEKNAISFSEYNGNGKIKELSQGDRVRPSLQESSGSIFPNQVQYDPSGEELEEVESEVPDYVVG